MSAPTEIVAALMAEKRGSHDVMGYNPYKVLETMRSSALFRAWFDALPADLTGIDLSPLYLLAETGDETRELSVRARKWRPDPTNLSDQYNGPVGPEGKADPWLVSRWREAVEKAKRDHETRFEADWRTMLAGDVPQRLHEAAGLLVGLALKPAPCCSSGDWTEWDDCADAVDIVAIDAAIRLCLAALCEHEATAHKHARESLASFRTRAQKIEKVIGSEA